MKFLDDLTRVFIDSLLRGLHIFVIGDLNCNLLSDDYESRAFLDFCTTFNITQLINSLTRITESSQSLIDVIMTTNKEIVTSSGVLTSSISDHNLIYLLLDLKVPRARPFYVSIRSYKKYNPTKFLEDLQLVPFHMVNSSSFLMISVIKWMCVVYCFLMSSTNMHRSRELKQKGNQIHLSRQKSNSL